jgi:hypothetical protein
MPFCCYRGGQPETGTASKFVVNDEYFGVSQQRGRLRLGLAESEGSALMSAPKKPDDGSREPTTFYEIEKNRLLNPGEDRPCFDVRQLPAQPRGSVWGPGPGPGREEFIDRTEDGE